MYIFYELTTSFLISPILGNLSTTLRKIEIRKWNAAFSSIVSGSNWIGVNFDLVWMILADPNTQQCIELVSLRLYTLSFLLQILDLCSDWANIKSVNLRYQISKFQNDEEIIKIATDNFTRKVGIISKLSIWK